MTMVVIDHLENAYHSLKRNRARSVLTTLGISIGIASVTCILALSSGVSPVSYTHLGSTFGFRTNNVSSIMPNIPFGLRALAGRAPAHPTDHLTVYFEQPSTVPFQTEGEYDELHDITELFVYKDPAKVLHLLRPGTRRRQEK